MNSAIMRISIHRVRHNVNAGRDFGENPGALGTTGVAGSSGIRLRVRGPNGLAEQVACEGRPRTRGAGQKLGRCTTGRERRKGLTFIE